MKIFCNNELISDNAIIAKSFFEKLLGKFFSSKPVILENCNSIHTIFMRKKIDVIFLDKDNKVIKKRSNILPNKIILPTHKAKRIIEFHAGFIKSAKIELNDKIDVKE